MARHTHMYTHAQDIIHCNPVTGTALTVLEYRKRLDLTEYVGTLSLLPHLSLPHTHIPTQPHNRTPTHTSVCVSVCECMRAADVHACVRACAHAHARTRMNAHGTWIGCMRACCMVASLIPQASRFMSQFACRMCIVRKSHVHGSHGACALWHGSIRMSHAACA